eukprot:TRINITY_DN6692_c0_g1_i1.p1 TRINITY_DN6692_c0_g1~~TRINITY_DN6692_c0_g1_i1.p1  ORF type:complete len:156 (-),score=22.22 TRINITY_DN6692_c0_g1_i1:31-498(-)
MTKQISSERKVAYYIGMGLMILGGILFASTFVTFIMNFGNFNNFESNAKSGMLRAFGGIALLIVGGIIRGIGALGVAGSGVKLNPQQAKEELEPYSRMAGGMIKDVLDESEINIGGKSEKNHNDKMSIMRAIERRRFKILPGMRKKIVSLTRGTD